MSRNELARYEIIVTTDAEYGMSSKGKIPWSSKDGRVYFEEKTIGNGRNVVIVGRVTFETLFAGRNLKNREVFVLSKSWKASEHSGVFVYPDIRSALMAASNDNYDRVYVCGGSKLFNEIGASWLYLCDKIHVVKYKIDYKCDTRFPAEILEGLTSQEERNQTFIRNDYDSSVICHREANVQQLLMKLVTKGGFLVEKHLYGKSLNFELGKKFPLLTTNLQDIKGLTHKVLFAIQGGCDSCELEERGCDIFKKVTDKVSQNENDTNLEEGDLGAWWGYQMTRWGRPYLKCDVLNPSEQYPGVAGFNQLEDAIYRLKGKDRFVVIQLWNPTSDSGVLPSRYQSLSLVLNQDRTVLSSIFTVRRCEALTQLGEDIFTGGLLTVVVALMIGATAGSLKITFMDLHSSHHQELERQAGRTPFPFTTLTVKATGRVNKAAELGVEKFVFGKYESWPVINPRPDEILKIKTKKAKR